MQRRTLFLSLIATAFLVVGLTACQPGGDTPPEELASQQVPINEGSPDEAPQTADTPTGIDAASFQSRWEASPHAQTYVLDDLGMNSTCARCHAPVEYIPSMDDMPESCASCKFEVDPPPPLIAETAWGNIPCKVCHHIKRGEVEPAYAWLAVPPIDEYEDLATTTELCIKCHTAVDVTDHTSIDVAGAHVGYTCTQCHDAHSTTASCETGSCHPDVLTRIPPIPGHADIHNAVTCGACHDAEGLAVGPDEEGNWITFQPASSIPIISHNIVKESLCERCHFLNNPWNLSEEVSR